MSDATAARRQARRCDRFTWQRVLDFGSSDVPEDTQGNGVTYLFVTPNNGATARVRTALSNAAVAEEKFVEGSALVPTGVLVHWAAVVDGAARALTLYQDGVSLGSVDLVDTSLTRLNDVNNWIGRSQWTFDDEVQGTVSEFRIYGAARSAEQIAASSAAGPDALPPGFPGVPYRTSNGCSETFAQVPVDGCTSGGVQVNPGCRDFDGCSQPTRWCQHDDPQYGTSHHGVPCFGARVIKDFFDSYR